MSLLSAWRKAAVMMILALTSVAAWQSPARAGTDIDLRAGLYTDSGAFAIGGGFLTPIGMHAGWFFNPNIALAMPDGSNTLSLNADVHYDFPTSGSLSPYLGAGPTLIRFDSDGGNADTNLGLNLVAGLAGLRGGIRTFVQIKGVLSDGSELALMGGIRF